MPYLGTDFVPRETISTGLGTVYNFLRDHVTQTLLNAVYYPNNVLSWLGHINPEIVRTANILTFGDSYTDLNGGSDGGTLWPVYAAGYGHYNLTGLARSGATCSEALTPRSEPDIIHDEIPAYLAAKDSLGYAADETTFIIWIGTNDIGVLEAGGETAGVTYRDTTECAVGWVKTMYDSGARNFVFMNVIPLQYSPSYNSNNAAIAFLEDTIPKANSYAQELLQAYAANLEGTHIGYFDGNTLFQEIIDNPYLPGGLNGTDPNGHNVSGDVSSACPDCTSDQRDSWMWIYGLHPTEQMDRLVAQHITAALEGDGAANFMTWYS